MATFNPFKSRFWTDTLSDPAHLFGESDEDAARRAQISGIQQSAFNDLDRAIPGQLYTDDELKQLPEFADLQRQASHGQITPQELERRVEMLRRHGNSVEYGQVDGNSLDYIDPEYINGRTQGYDAETADNAYGRAIGGEAEREGLAGSQRSSIDRTMDIANQGGLSAIDRARIAEQRAGQEQWLKGQRGATLADMQERGLSGSGAEMASILSDQQASADRNALAGTQIEGMAQQRQDQALRDAFSMSSDARGQSFDEASHAADATNEMNRWNSQVGTDANRYWADVQNRGIEQDVGIHNAAEGANSDIRNNNAYYNQGQRDRGQDATRQEGWNFYNAQAQNAAGRTGAQTQLIQGNIDADAARDQQQTQAVGQIFGTIASAPNNNNNNQNNQPNGQRLNPIDTEKEKSGTVSLPKGKFLV
jgi:hypothetical protein